jgi:hypothetical protein
MNVKKTRKITIPWFICSLLILILFRTEFISEIVEFGDIQGIFSIVYVISILIFVISLGVLFSSFKAKYRYLSLIILMTPFIIMFLSLPFLVNVVDSELVLVGLIFLFISVAIGYKFFSILKKEKNCTIMDEAIIKDISESSINTRRISVNTKTYHISYLGIKGFIYENDLNVERELKVGDKIKIKYNPMDKYEFLAVDEF